jgi:hypothetical protein
LIRILAAAVGLLLVACSSENDSGHYVTNRAVPISFGIGPSNICLPIGRLLLIQTNGDRFALKIDAAYVSRSGAGYRATISVSRMTSVGWSTGVQNVNERALRGFVHPFFFQTGQVAIKLGAEALAFNGPSCVSMFPIGTGESDQGLRFAPTGWKSLNNVRWNSSELRWYRVDLDRSLSIPISRLPGDD